MDSVEFCGQVCHHVMGPEYTVYQLSPHAGVACVECHIGPGPEYFVKAKVNGARQVVQVATNTYHRPIGVPVHALRPAHEICGHCHHEQQYRGDRMKVLQQRDEDRDNTPRHTVVNLRLGGEGGHGWEPQGIHWHASRDVKLTFRTTDHQRQDVVSIRVEQDGEVRTWSRRGRDEHGREIGEGGGGTEASVDAHEAEVGP